MHCKKITAKVLSIILAAVLAASVPETALLVSAETIVENDETTVPETEETEEPSGEEETEEEGNESGEESTEETGDESGEATGDENPSEEGDESKEASEEDSDSDEEDSEEADEAEDSEETDAEETDETEADLEEVEEIDVVEEDAELLYDSADADGFIWADAESTVITRYTGSAVNVLIPEKATEIGMLAFSGNTTMKTLDLRGSHVTTIGVSAFSDCNALETVYISETLERTEETSENFGPFYGCTALNTVTFESGLQVIPEYIFSNLGSSLTAVNIPDTVTEIGMAAFLNCSGLTSVILPEGITSIGHMAFADCNLTTIDLPDALEVIGIEAFYGNTAVTEITIPKGVKKIELNSLTGLGPFAGCDSLTTVNFESGMTDIPDEIFSQTTSITTVNIPDTVRTIGARAFWKCTGITSINLPDSITSIGHMAFADCNLTTIDLPDALEVIGIKAFEGNTAVTEITIPKGVKKVEINSLEGAGPFAGCDGLTTVNFESGMTDIPDEIFSQIASITTVNIPDSVKTIGTRAFWQCSGLSAIDLPDSITEIRIMAFAGCNLTTVTLPAYLKKLEMQAFAGNVFLEEVYFGNELSYIGNGTFSETDENIKLFVVQGTTTEKTLRASGYGSLIQYYDGPEYTITYANCEGATNPNPGSYFYASAFTLKNPVKSGYTFQGWYTNSNFKTKITAITKGSSGSKTLYAKWSVNKYTVKFNKNGGTGTTKAMSCVCDRDYALRANKFKRKGYLFLGWARSKTGPVVYTNGQSVRDLTTRNKGTVTLYAVWQKIDYTITYNLNGGTNGANPATYTVTNTVKLKSASKPGYTFKGWYKDAKLKKKVSKIAKGSTGNKIFYAKYAGNKYLVAFNANGATGSVAAMSGTYRDGLVLPDSTGLEAADGKIFAGWNTSADGTGTHYDAGDSIAVFAKPGKKATKVTLYAEWTE